MVYAFAAHVGIGGPETVDRWTISQWLDLSAGYAELIDKIHPKKSGNTPTLVPLDQLTPEEREKRRALKNKDYGDFRQ